MVNTQESTMVKREQTSINIDPNIWKEVRKTAIDEGISATDFFERALINELEKTKSNKQRIRPHTT
jgi:hypothetical protein